jgi:DNA modification methylase
MQKSFLGRLPEKEKSEYEKIILSGNRADDLVSYLDSASPIDGIPKSPKESIVNLSLPPFYTACPNPFIFDSLSKDKEKVQGKIVKHPITEDVSVGKNDPLYFAHFYSTKVPPQAIVPYVLHYTNPGENIFDGFCGTGMTGVAAQLCEYEHDQIKRGKRYAILNDLSPAATFIASVTNAIHSLSKNIDQIEKLILEVEKENQKLLFTKHTGWKRGTSEFELRKNSPTPKFSKPGRIRYTVWSDVFLCQSCGSELIYWDLIFTGPGNPIPKKIHCSYCGSEVSIRSLERVYETFFDTELQKTIRQAKQVPVLINYSFGNTRYEKEPDEADLANLEFIQNYTLPKPVPIVELPDGFNTQQPINSHGFTHVHHFFTKRNLLFLSEVWAKFNEIDDPIVRNGALYILTGAIQRICRLNRYMPSHDRHVGPLSGTLYVSQITAEIPATDYMLSRIKDIRRIRANLTGENVYITTQSATDLSNIPDESIHYIFTDPPFGGNLNYSELNILVEAWLGVITNSKKEAVVNQVQGKNVEDYQRLMEDSFREFFRVLKSGRWITVEFHNSQNAIWMAIQEALGNAGFLVSDVRILDKKKGTTKQLSYSSAVKQDLVISAYKPTRKFEKEYQATAGTLDGVWTFVRQYLEHLPIISVKNNLLEIIPERQDFLLFDHMVAFHIRRGTLVPISAAEFYAGLKQRFPGREGMYFLPEQLTEYDRTKLDTSGISQLSMFVTDEKSTRQWLRKILDIDCGGYPQTYQEIQPQFLQQLQKARHEQLPELLEILEQNFLQDEQGRWYVPDPNKASDLEKIRNRSLLREFNQYLEEKKQLKQFRTEAVRAGFADAWQRKDFATIVNVAEKLPENILQEDPDLLMYYDNASLRVD